MRNAWSGSRMNHKHGSEIDQETSKLKFYVYGLCCGVRKLCHLSLVWLVGISWLRARQHR